MELTQVQWSYQSMFCTMQAKYKFSENFMMRAMNLPIQRFGKPQKKRMEVCLLYKSQGHLLMRKALQSGFLGRY